MLAGGPVVRKCRAAVVIAPTVPRVNPILSPLRARGPLMARQWSARSYGVARQREGSRQNSLGGSGVLSLRHFGLAGWFSLSLGAWVPKKLARRILIYWFRRHDAARPAPPISVY
jgi:hypothetical protein